VRTSNPDEIHLLEKGKKYNLYQKPKDWKETPPVEAETAISQLEL
jgi:hypothetical protein